MFPICHRKDQQTAPLSPQAPKLNEQSTSYTNHKRCVTRYSYCVPLCFIQVSYTPHTIHHLNAPSEPRIKNSQWAQKNLCLNLSQISTSKHQANKL